MIDCEKDAIQIAFYLKSPTRKKVCQTYSIIRIIFSATTETAESINVHVSIVLPHRGAIRKSKMAVRVN